MEEGKPEAKDFDEMADDFFSKQEKETPEESSTENKPEDDKSTDETTGAEPAKSEKVKAVDEDDSLTPEEKIEKIKGILGDDEEALDAYIKSKGYHKDPAWQKQREEIEKWKKAAESSGLSEEDKAALEEFKKFRSSAEYIQTSMRAQGYKEEAINKKLEEMGYDVPSDAKDDVQLVIDKLGLDPESIDKDVKANIADIARIADVLINDRLGKVLPKELGPLQEHIQSNEKVQNSQRMVSQMRETVKGEGILDFEKDIEPALHKFMDENLNASQKDVLDHFNKINHKLSVERLRTGSRKQEREEKKSHLRQNIPTSRGSQSLPQKTGDFEKDFDAAFDAMSA